MQEGVSVLLGVLWERSLVSLGRSVLIMARSLDILRSSTGVADVLHTWSAFAEPSILIFRSREFQRSRIGSEYLEPGVLELSQ